MGPCDDGGRGGLYPWHGTEALGVLVVQHPGKEQEEGNWYR